MDGIETLQVVIVDDHHLVRQEICSILESYPGIQIVGEARDGFEALLSLERTHPCMVLMDVNMPKMNGIEATAHIRIHYPDIIIIGLSVNATSEIQEAMRRAGAVRLIPKDLAADQLYDAVLEAVTNQKTS